MTYFLYLFYDFFIGPKKVLLPFLSVTRSHAPVVNMFIGSNYVDDDGQVRKGTHSFNVLLQV